MSKEQPTSSSQPFSNKSSRRAFAKRSIAGTAAISSAFGFQFVPGHVWGANSRIQLGGIGSGGKGVADIGGSAKVGMNVAALVDIVDTKRLSLSGADQDVKKLQFRLSSMSKTRQEYPDAKFYGDYREMIADMGDKIDAVTISTPDHHHFHAAALAMKAGKHVYCQKPLTHGIWEARTLTELADKTGVQTQMGNQAHANDHMRRVAELLRAGIVGEVKEIHAWTNRPVWPQGFAETPKPAPVPVGIDWEQWIGPAPFVDYSPHIAPFAWRGWWNYGTGALGDMACHIMDMAYWALELGAPTSVKAEAEGGSALSAPINSTLVYDFAHKGIKFHWYDGQKGAKFDSEKWRLVPGEFNRPSDDILEGVDYRKYGSVIIGDRGKLYFNRFHNTWFVSPGNIMDGFETPKPSIPRAQNEDNYAEWRDAIEGKVAHGQSYFGYAGPFTETILLGVVAQKNPGETLKWDAEKLEFTDRPDLNSQVKRSYRPGWEIEV